MSGIIQQPSKMVVINANIVTMDPSCPLAEWVAISHGTIRAVGMRKDYKEFTSSNTELIDCGGRTVLPGFIDAHLHLHAFVESCVSLNLSWTLGFKSIADIQGGIKNRCKETPPRTWIRGRGYNEFYLTEKRHPTRWDLDEVSPDHPVKLAHRSGHAHVLNSLALSLVGVSRETGDPPGGLIDRDVATGEPTGLLYEMGGFLSERIPPFDKRELLRGLNLANHDLLSLGITSLQDASYVNDVKRWEEIVYWKKEGLFGPRINFMLGPKGFQKFRRTRFSDFSGPVSEDQLRIRGVKVILDETTGQLHPPQKELNEMVLEIHRAGLQVAVHAIEENAVGSACCAIEYALDRIPKSDPRHRIEHCSVCSPPLLKGLGSLRIIVVTQPSFIFYNGDRYIETIPGQKLQHLYPIGSLFKAGIAVAGSSDCPVVPPNPLIGIYSAVSRKSQAGKIIAPGESIEPLEALRMYTTHASRASFDENIKGSITPGKVADLVVLDGDPTTIPADEIKEVEVGMTILNGDVVWSRKG
jgi:predicted amidohydrolase YtcJ